MVCVMGRIIAPNSLLSLVIELNVPGIAVAS